VNAPARPSHARWLLVLIPAAIIAVIEEVSDAYLDPSLPFPLDTLVVAGTVFVLAFAFAWFAFGRLDRLTSALRAQNAELEARSASARALNRVSVAIAAESGLDDTLAALRRFVALSSPEELPLVTLSGYADKPGDAAQNAELMAEARALGREMAARLGRAPTSAGGGS